MKGRIPRTSYAVDPSWEPPDVSVVICAHNGARDLPHLFEALDRQTLPAERYEVIVVDDASIDATTDLVKNHNRAHLIRAEKQVGLPRARNLGMARAGGTLIALTDADTTPIAAWLERGVECFRKSGADLLAGGIDVPLGARPSTATLLDAATHFDQEESVARGFGVGANLWLTRDLFERLGGFNERLAAYGGDDNEFGQRVTAAGARLLYAPEVALTHPPRSSLADLARKRYRLGFGLAAHRRFNPGPLGQTPRLFLQPRQYCPHYNLLKVNRLRDAGYRPSKPQVLKLHLARWLVVQLPRTFGDLRGELSFRRVRKAPDA